MKQQDYYKIDWSLRETRQKFYKSPEWKMIRNFVLSKKPLCVHCQNKGIITVATEVDHIIDVSDDPARRLDITNLQGLCKSCHSLKTSQNQANSEKDLTPLSPTWDSNIKKLK